MDKQPLRRISVCLWLETSTTPGSQFANLKQQQSRNESSEASQRCAWIVVDQVRGSIRGRAGATAASGGAGAIGIWSSRVRLASELALDDLVVLRILESGADGGILAGSIDIGSTSNIGQGAEGDFVECAVEVDVTSDSLQAIESINSHELGVVGKLDTTIDCSERWEGQVGKLRAVNKGYCAASLSQVGGSEALEVIRVETHCTCDICKRWHGNAGNVSEG